LRSIKPLGGNRGPLLKPGVPGGITQPTTSWTRVWSSTRGRSTFMEGPGRRRPQTCTHRKLPSNPSGKWGTLASTENFPAQSGPRRDIPARDKQMPRVQKPLQQHSGTLRSRPSSLSHLPPGKLQRCPRRPAAERGPYLEITDTQRKRSAQDHTCRAPPRPCTLGGRTQGP